MNIQSRLLTVDFYNCKGEKFYDEEALRTKITETLHSLSLTPMQIIADGEHSSHLSLLVLLPDGHLALHVHPRLRHVSLDIYLCAKDAVPDPIAQSFRKIFQPEKTKSTHLRRGDFRSFTEIKPKTTTRVAPFRKIKSTAAKVIRSLARHNR